MIKRTIPYKECFTPKRESNCCSYYFQTELKNEQFLEIDKKNKNRANSLNLHTNSTPLKETIQNNQIFKTPRMTNSHTRTNSLRKNTFGTTATSDRTHYDQQINEGPQDVVMNPLNRIKQRKQQGRRISRGSIKNSSNIIFNYFTPKNDLNLSSTDGFVCRNIGGELNVQAKQIKIKEQIQKYRTEYKQLLQEFQNLKQQKQTNMEKFKELLDRLKKKEQEILQLQQLRKQQLGLLREQLRSYLQQQGLYQK